MIISNVTRALIMIAVMAAMLVMASWGKQMPVFPGAFAQEAAFGESIATSVVNTRIREIEQHETSRQAWGLSEADWSRYRDLMSGPSGLWYSHLAPTVVLGINAESDAGRQRFARIVWEQEQQRLDNLFAFNRAYQQVARNARSQPGFSLFEEQLLQSPRFSSNPPSHASATSRITAFVRPDCPQCDRDIRLLVAVGKPMDIYVVGVQSDREIRNWATRVDIPLERVVNRSITLNHDSRNRLGRAGYPASSLPLFFANSDRDTPIDPESLLQGKP